jgi:hypothetical protein
MIYVVAIGTLGDETRLDGDFHDRDAASQWIAEEEARGPSATFRLGWEPDKELGYGGTTEALAQVELLEREIARVRLARLLEQRQAREVIDQYRRADNLAADEISTLHGRLEEYQEQVDRGDMR